MFGTLGYIHINRIISSSPEFLLGIIFLERHISKKPKLIKVYYLILYQQIQLGLLIRLVQMSVSTRWFQPEKDGSNLDNFELKQEIFETTQIFLVS